MQTIHKTKPTNNNYPNLLKQIKKPPSPLFYRGTLPPKDALTIAIVGSRKATHYGRKLTNQIVEALAEKGIIIVSGLAFGIDIAAHMAAIKSGGTTVAVLANSLDHESIAPASHQEEAEILIAAGGALISEYPEKTPAYKGNYHARNRIISGIAKATIVIECTRKSGTMITANSAIRQNRDVYALPGAITSPNSEGPNQLIREGATPITSIETLLKDLQINQTKQTILPILNLSPEELQLLQQIPTEPKQLHEITKQITWPAQKITKILTTLEIKGQIAIMSGGYIAKT